MAKALVALVLACLVMTAVAADAGRELQQVTAAKFDCDGAKMLATTPPIGGKPACAVLCQCAGALNKNYMATNMQKFCNDTCSKCAAAGLKCTKGGALPNECKAGQSIKEVQSCINSFLSARGH